jgi:hypothetical protein
VNNVALVADVIPLFLERLVLVNLIMQLQKWLMNILAYVGPMPTALQKEVGAFALIIRILMSNMEGVFPQSLKQKTSSR